MRATEPNGIQPMNSNTGSLKRRRETARKTESDLVINLMFEVGARQSDKERLDPSEQVSAIDMKDSHHAMAR
jgi:hypothetical protein